jgi:NitT/TauT family transport system permease protein
MLWTVASMPLPDYILPGPLRVFASLQALIVSGELWRHLSITLGRVAAGFLVAALVGLPLGMLLGSNRRAGVFFEPVLPALNTISSAIWAIFAIIWFGVSNATTVFVVLMTALPLVITNVWQGTRAVNADFIELAHMLRLTRPRMMLAVYLPSIFPYFFSGSRLAFGFGWRVSLAAEALGASSGVGYRLRQAADLIQTDQVFAWTLTMVLMMVAIEMLVLKPVETRLFRWRKQAEAA